MLQMLWQCPGYNWRMYLQTVDTKFSNVYGPKPGIVIAEALVFGLSKA